MDGAGFKCTSSPNAKRQGAATSDSNPPAKPRPHAPAPAAEQDRSLTESRRQAKVVQDGFIPALMQRAMSPTEVIDGPTVRGYRDELLREMGNPADALERMLIEQAAVAHVMTMKLHASTALAKTPEGAGIYAVAAAKLMAELRRTILAVREYRTPPARPQVTKIEQQNVAQTQAVSYVTRPGESDVRMECREKPESHSELGSNERETGDGAAGTNRLREIFSPSRGGAAEPAAAGAAD